MSWFKVQRGRTGRPEGRGVWNWSRRPCGTRPGATRTGSRLRRLRRMDSSGSDLQKNARRGAWTARKGPGRAWGWNSPSSAANPRISRPLRHFRCAADPPHRGVSLAVSSTSPSSGMPRWYSSGLSRACWTRAGRSAPAHRPALPVSGRRRRSSGETLLGRWQPGFTHLGAEFIIRACRRGKRGRAGSPRLGRHETEQAGRVFGFLGNGCQGR